MSRIHQLADELFGDGNDLLGEEDDADETPELGIDYAMSDRMVEETMGEGRAPIVVANPGGSAKQKVLRKRFSNITVDRAKRIAVIDFEDGSRLTITP